MKRRVIQFEASLSVTFLKEKKRFVAYSPALDLSTSGKTYREAKKRFAEAAALFFEEVHKNKTIDEVLGNLGWRRTKKEWHPPVVVGHESEAVRVPVAA